MKVPEFRTYGQPPFRVALIHGGPGAPGTMGPLAELLFEAGVSVLEPLQRARSIAGLQRELTEVLEQQASGPVVLVGHSWGAMLSTIFAAAHPQLVRKLILVGSGAFEEAYAADIKTTRLARLTDDERARAHELMRLVEARSGDEQNSLLRELSELFDRADNLDPITLDTGLIAIDARQHRAIWTEARELRSSGRLLELAEQIECPVVAIHGDFDPHPAAGVAEPLASRLADFELLMLERCGHIPWIERRAKEPFIKILLSEIG